MIRTVWLQANIRFAPLQREIRGMKPNTERSKFGGHLYYEFCFRCTILSFQTDKTCKCSGWKNSNCAPNQSRLEPGQTVVHGETPCRTCNHSLASHVLLLQNKPDEELDKLLSMVIDVETLYVCVNNEKDEHTKKLYLNLFKLLRRSISQAVKPTVEVAFLGSPPFEKPNIESVR